MLPPLSTIIMHIAASRYFSFAGFTVLIYDHMLTFGDEVKFVWSQPMNTVSIIFLVNRYLTPTILVVDIYEKGGLLPYATDQFCRIWVLLDGYLNLFILASIHVLMIMRVQALWGNRKRLNRVLTIAFWLYFLTSTSILTVGILEIMRTIRFESVFSRVCWTEIPKYLWAVWLPALILESLIFALTTIRAWQHSAEGMHADIIYLLWRDGFQYFVGIMVCTLFPLLVWAVGAPTLFALPKYGALALISTLSFRITLNLRRHSTGMNSFTVFQGYEQQNQSLTWTERAKIMTIRSSRANSELEHMTELDLFRAEDCDA